MKTTLEHLPQQNQQEIQTLVKRLLEAFKAAFSHTTSPAKQSGRILKIILFGSYAKGRWVNDPEHGYVSDYDVLVIVNNEKLVEEYRFWNQVEEQIQQEISVPFSPIVHSLTDVNAQLKEGHYFFKDILQDGVLLYDGNHKPLVKPGNLSPVEAKTIAEKHFKLWFHSAISFRLNYGHGMDRSDYKNAAFELHQATERFFACILLVYTNYRPKTHNLIRLLALCVQQEPRFMALFPQDTKYHRRCFMLLKRAYIEARYSEHYAITQEELTWLGEQVTELQSLTEKVCREKIAGFLV
jgi:HEPN domain-containing protein/predicted nucleotidyltransferase